MQKIYPTTNPKSPDNDYTSGQCGGMCALWLANMFKRKSMKNFSQTRPPWDALLMTHLAAFHAPERKYEWYTGEKRSARPITPADVANTKSFDGDFTPPNVANTNILSSESADLRCIAAAGLKVVASEQDVWSSVAGVVGRRRKGASKGWFIDVGGHAIAVFTVCEKPASYEKAYRFYFFDPNAGCYYSDDDSPYRKAFQILRKNHEGRNLGLKDFWHYYKVVDVSGIPDLAEEEDMGIGALFS